MSKYKVEILFGSLSTLHKMCDSEREAKAYVEEQQEDNDVLDYKITKKEV